MYYRYLILLFIICLSIDLDAQLHVRNKADELFEKQLYSKALDQYNKYQNAFKRTRPELRKAICLYELGLINESILQLEKVQSLDRSESEVFYYYGLCFHDIGDYQSASSYWKKYLQEVKDDGSSERIEKVLRLIEQCEYAQDLIQLPRIAYTENLGMAVNTVHDEIRPKFSPTRQNRIYFSSNNDISQGGLTDNVGTPNELYGTYKMDIIGAELKNGIFTKIYPFNEQLNSNNPEVIQSFSSSGNKMYYILDDLKTNEKKMLVDFQELDGERPIFDAPFFPEIGDTDFTMISDSLFLFSSKRDGGYGGYDIYFCSKSNDRWDTPVNLGETINSPSNDRCPFLTSGGTELYFSSDRIYTIGGFDVFHTVYDSGYWTTPTNLGPSINSTRDDLYMTISADGTQGILASDRIEGNGGFDLYNIYWINQVMDQLNFNEEIVLVDSVQIQKITRSNEEIFQASVPKVTFVNTPLYITSSNEIWTGENNTSIKTLLDFLKLYPSLNIMLLDHSVNAALRQFNLYFGLKRVDQIKDHLISQGINKERITTGSVGDAYPPLANDGTGQSQKFNNRVDVLFTTIDTNKFEIISKINTVVAASNQTERYKSYLNLQDAYHFKIKLAETDQMWQSNVLMTFDNIFVTEENGRNHYFLGEYMKLIDAEKAVLELSTNWGLQGVTIAPFKGFTKILSPKNHIDQFKELELYLNKKSGN